MGPLSEDGRPEATGLLILAYGNELRGDDGAGPALARRLCDALPEDAHVIVKHQLTPELSDDLSKAAHVVFVDARIPDGNPDAVLTSLAVEQSACGAQRSAGVGHRFDPASLIELTRAVFGRSPEAWVLSLPSESMALGAELSDAARSGIDHGLELLRGHMRRLGYTA